MKIRIATKEDCPAMLKLIRELADYEKAPEEVTVDSKHFEESGFGPNPVWWAFVVESVEAVEGVEVTVAVEAVEEYFKISTSSTLSTPSTSSTNIIAFALCYIRYSTWKGQVMYLEDFLVTEPMRGKGIGKMLLDRLIIEAKERGFKRIVWQVLDWNEPAINFYKKYNVTFDDGWMNVSLDF